ncbi:MAG: hypothetical protein CME40_15085 [Haliea sp.]|jgi:hypothetical protein|nr:hypothetical protein [Haliea sp.]|tara:strand:- start:2550 stop:2744 length:195 start_codon:yes stop_codon:yes gene_type:complete
MNQQNTAFDPRELSSRKLWQIVVQSDDRQRDACSRRAVQELTQRRRYLRELNQLNAPGEPRQGR